MADRKLDPDMTSVLAALANLPPMESMTLDELRSSMVPLPPELRTRVARVEDLAVPGLVPLRLYEPLKLGQDALILFFHGGGFVIGSIESHDHLARDIATATGCRLLSVDYRLAPEHKFPAAIDDCLAVARWALADGVSRLGCRAVILAGDSAGGNLAAVTAIRLRDLRGSQPKGMVLAYPVTDFHSPPRPSYLHNATGYSLTRPAMVRFWQDYLDSEEQARDPLAAPIRHPDLSSLPATLVITAGFDPLRDEGADFARQLGAAGVAVTHIDHAQLIHGFLRMGHVSTRARAALSEIGQWVADLLEERGAC